MLNGAQLPGAGAAGHWVQSLRNTIVGRRLAANCGVAFASAEARPPYRARADGSQKAVDEHCRHAGS